jgi:6-phosphogluconolactonase
LDCQVSEFTKRKFARIPTDYVVRNLGGSVVKLLSAAIPKVKTDFAKWRVFFCDERLVDIEDPESTYGLYKKQLLAQVPELTEQFLVPLYSEPDGT